MQRRSMQRSVYELGGTSIAQRVTLAVIVGLWVELGWWLLLGGGLETARDWLGWISESGGAVRRVCLAAAFSIYYIRLW